MSTVSYDMRATQWKRKKGEDVYGERRLLFAEANIPLEIHALH